MTRLTFRTMALVSAAAAIVALAGCAELSKLTTPAAQPFVQVAVDAAVGLAVGNDAATQKVRATQIKSIATQVLQADSGTSATLAALEGVVNAKLATLKLPAADMAAAQLLTATLAAVIQSQLSSSTAASSVTAQTQVAVSQIMNDVINATSVYGV